jgi:hypothetical protein
MLALAAKVVASPPPLTVRIEVLVSGIAEIIDARCAFACELVAEGASPWRYSRCLIRQGGGRWQPAIKMIESLACSSHIPAGGTLTVLGDALPPATLLNVPTQAECYFRSRRTIVSTRHVAGSVICLAFCRSRGEFGERDVIAMDLLFGSLWAQTSPAARQATFARGPRRQVQVLELFKRGMSEKQAALRLGLSPNTVHHHAKRLNEKYGVSSRSELLSLFVR